MLTGRIRSGILSRSYVFLLVLLVLFAGLVYHVGTIQLGNHEYYARQARGISMKTRDAAAHRGSILDLNGNIFAGDLATRDVHAEPKRFVGDLDVATKIIAKHLGIDEGLLLKRFEKSASHEFSVKISGGVPPSFVREKGLSRIAGLTLRPVRDANGAVASFKVFFHPYRVTPEERKVSCGQICEYFDITRPELERETRQALERCQEISVKRGVSREVAEEMLAELKAAGIKRGVRFTDSWVRYYPRDTELANLLGFTDSENSGVSGVEQLMDKFLRPVVGKVAYSLDSDGRPVDDDPKVLKEASNGADVYLTIQEPIQRILEEELRVLWETNRPTRAYAIMMDPSTGAIMGLAQFPQFNPNDRETMEDPDNCQNHVMHQSYDPGSIMKAVSLSCVLDSGVADLNSVKDCEKGRWIYNRKALRDSHRYDELTLAEVIQKSSNIGTAKFSLDLGEERMYKYLVNFGFGRATGLGFYPSEGEPVVFRWEPPGLFRELHLWDSLTITRVPMGQGITVPLMQIMQSWSALANNGVIMQPYLIDRVVYPDGTTEYSQPHAKSEPVSANAVKKMTKALTMVTEKGGTGTRAAVKGFKVAGKTGTAQMWIMADKAKGVKGHYAENQFLASFIGFAPADKPRFLLLVSAENPTEGYHTGSGVAAPVFRRIAEKTLEYLQVPPEEAPAKVEPARRATARNR